MAIECGTCNEEKWCLYDDGEWICRDCFLEEGGDSQEWNDLNEEAKRRREEKRAGLASAEYDDFAPSTKPSAKPCKYGCKTMIFWDNTSKEKNKFVESETALPHTFKRCSEKLKAVKK